MSYVCDLIEGIKKYEEECKRINTNKKKKEQNMNISNALKNDFQSIKKLVHYKRKEDDVLLYYIETPGVPKENISIKIINDFFKIKISVNTDDDALSEFLRTLYCKDDYTLKVTEEEFNILTSQVEYKNGLITIKMYKKESYNPKTLTIL